MSLFFEATLLAAAFLGTTCFGFLLVFAIVVMPGISRLDDGDFLRAFQVIDGVIQDNQPIFVSTWIGSVVAFIAAAIAGWFELDGGRRFGLMVATGAYMTHQVITFTINVPMNNRLKELDIAYLDSSAKKGERVIFERKWCFWNWLRTIIMGAACFYLVFLLLVIED
jgi:uncharacterized membrane protein